MNDSKITVVFTTRDEALFNEITQQRDRNVIYNVLTGKNKEYEVLFEKVNIGGKVEVHKLKFDGLEVLVCLTPPSCASAAAAIAQILTFYKVMFIYHVGFAGSLTDKLKIGDIIISDKVKRIDVDFTAFVGTPVGVYKEEFDKNPNFDGFEPHLAITNYLSVQSKSFFPAHKAYAGTIYSSERFFADNDKKQILLHRFKNVIQALDIDSASIAQVATDFNVPFICAKAITDYADENAVKDFEKNREAARMNMTRMILASIPSLISIKKTSERN